MSPVDRADADILRAFVLGCSRAQLVLQPSLTPAQQTRYESLLARRAAGEPVAYLTGEKEFWSLTLNVTPDVLIPRPDTELLVEWALQLAPQRVADVGTGSGAIALALAKELPQARFTATDISAPALAIARVNAQTLKLGNVEFLHGSLLEPLGSDFDLIVSNPPYIAERDPHLPALRYEPKLALTSGADGLDAIREIVGHAPAHLKSGGWLLLEHGADQGAAVRELMQKTGFTRVETRRDLAGHERASAGCWP